MGISLPATSQLTHASERDHSPLAPSGGISIGTAAGMSEAASIVAKQDQSGIAVSGIVTDSVCGGTHGTAPHGDAECTRMCVELGAGYALADGKKIYTLKGHEPELNRFAGDRVLVKGKIVGRDTVAVESVVPWVVEGADTRR
jgi:hypothetical protein